MFTLLVSWLLVACVPGLLMLATLGLGRLEREITRAPVTPVDVARYLAHAEAPEPLALRAPARSGMPEALDYLHRRQAQRVIPEPRRVVLPGPRTGRHHADPFVVAEFRVAMRVSGHSQTDQRFRTTRHIDRV